MLASRDEDYSSSTTTLSDVRLSPTYQFVHHGLVCKNIGDESFCLGVDVQESKSEGDDEDMDSRSTVSSDYDEEEEDESMSDYSERARRDTRTKRLTMGGAEDRDITTLSERREVPQEPSWMQNSVVIGRRKHSNALLHGVEFLRGRVNRNESKSFCDITLQAGGVQMPAHKAVLAAMSEELENMVLNVGASGVLQLPGVDARGLQCALSFIYNGTVEVTNADLPSVLKVFLLVHVLVLVCRVYHALRPMSRLMRAKTLGRE